MRRYNPRASESNTIVFGNARFQFMTDRMVRLEYKSSGVFEDRPTLAAVNRAFPDVRFSNEKSGNVLSLSTSALTLSYTNDGRAFSRDNLQISFDCDGKKKIWQPEMEDPENLGATLRTLDEVDGRLISMRVPNPDYIPNSEGAGTAGSRGQSLTEFIRVRVPVDLGSGLLSRSGWAVVDDSRNVLIDDSMGFEWVAECPEGSDADLYFLGYGRDYKTALKESAVLFGRQPLPPRYALGYWFSRYWAYTDKELERLAGDFEREGVPIDVLVVDMDWHLEGWTGYTWDRRYFPDPEEFLTEMHRRRLKVTLNLHPADGVGKHEEQFRAMAEAMNLDPEETRKIDFDITDPKYMNAYFDILHHPNEERGVDFWWIDWQQGESTKMKGLDTLPWINHLHWHDMAANPKREGKRPLIFSRWGGIGAGRYCIGFSGDTYSNWDSLAFQPYFTATAANVLYGYWSHDIGGHMPGPIEPELFTRWIQFGVYSPILRTHTSKDPDAERRVWEYPDPHSRIMMDAIRKRYELVPYIYTECRKAFDTGLSLCRPMYYEWPQEEAAYRAHNQYMFGDEMIVAPVIEKSSDTDDMANVSVWLPQGEWYDTARGLSLDGGRLVSGRYMLDEVPVFVRPGTIVPGENRTRRLDGMSIEDLLITIFGGTQGEYTLYEDDGKTVDYENDQSTSIRISHRRSGRTWKVRIDKPVGSYDGFISRKNIMLRIEGTVPAESVTVNGERVPFSFRPSDGNYWHYNGRTGSIDVALKQQELDDGLEIGLTLVDGKLESMQGWKGLMNRIELVSYYNTLATTFYVIHDEERLGVDLAQAGNRISRDPARYREEIERTRRRLKELPEVITSLRHHHAGEGDLRFAARRHPEKVQFCDKALSILEECTGSTAKASFDA